MPQTRILIADDHEVVRRGIRTVLETRSEWEVCAEAATATEAIAKAARVKPDVVLLDINFPDFSGLEAIPKIFKAYAATKIIVLTMQSSGSVACSVLAAGASGLVLKSDAAEDLILALQAVEQDKAFLSPAVTKILLDELQQAPAVARDVLTTRETEVLKLLAEGKTNKEISARLGTSPRTIDAHRASLMRKLKLGTLSDVIRYAIRHKIVEM